MAVLLNVTFDLVSADHAGELRLYAADVDETPTGNFQVYWGVTGPDGVTHKAFPSTPDATFSDNGNAEIFVRIPKDSTGAYLPGDYEIRVLLTDSDDPVNQYAVGTIDVAFQPYNAGTNAGSDYLVSLDTDYNCDTGNITAVATISHPSTISLSDEAIAVGDLYSSTNNEVSAGQAIFYYTNVDYVVSYSAVAEVSFVVDGTFNVYWLEEISISETVNIQCTLPDLCKVASCLEKEFKILEAKTCGKGWDSLTEKEKGKFSKAAAIARLILLYKGCGNNTKYREYVTDFETLMDCSCGCGDATTTADDPIPYLAPNLFID